MIIKEQNKPKKAVQKLKSKKLAMRFWKNCLLLILFLVIIHLWLKTKSYIFDEKDIVRIGKRHAGQDVPQAFQKIISSLAELYPGHILPSKHREWIMYKHSGATVSMTILHSSLTEYLILTGSALDTDGYIGRHWLNATGVVLSGSVKYWKEGTIQAIDYKPGDSYTILSGTTGCYSLKSNTWALEYGRGFVPISLPSIIFDITVTSFDVIGVFRLFRAFGVADYYQLKNQIASFIANL